MAESSRKKQLYSIITAVLVLVIFSIYVLELDDPPSNIIIYRNQQCQKKFMEAIDYDDWMDESRGSRRSNNFSSPLPQSSMFRELIFVEILSIDRNLSELSVQTAIINRFPNIKNYIPVKLLI